MNKYDIPMKILWTTYDIPMKILWTKYDIPMKILWTKYDIPMKILWTKYDIPMKILWTKYDIPMKIFWTKYDIPMKIQVMIVVIPVPPFLRSSPFLVAPWHPRPASKYATLQVRMKHVGPVGVSWKWGFPKWMVFVRENPWKSYYRWFGGSHILRNLHVANLANKFPTLGWFYPCHIPHFTAVSIFANEAVWSQNVVPYQNHCQIF